MIYFIAIAAFALALLGDNAAADEDIKAINQALIVKASEIQSLEYEIARADERGGQLREKLAEMETSRTKHIQLQKTAGASLMRIARRPQNMPLVSNIDLVRGELLLANIQKRANHLLNRLVARNSAIATLAAEVQHNEQALQQALKERVNIHRALETLLARKRKGLKTKNSAHLLKQAKKMAALSSQAHDTNALISKIIARAKRPNTQPSLDTPQFLKPGAGKVVSGFGDKNALGMNALGLGFSMLPSARIVAPVSGQAIFAGPFRRYGHILIIAAPGGYHLFLRGMARLDVRAGEALAAGEPIGLMPSAKKSPQGANQPILYLEVRKHGRPIDPTPLFAENIHP